MDGTGVGEPAGTVAVGLLCTAEAPVTGVADEAAAITTPATTATTPPTTPVTRPRMVQVEAGRVPGTGPSPVKRGASLGGWTGTRAASQPSPGRRPPGKLSHHHGPRPGRPARPETLAQSARFSVIAATTWLVPAVPPMSRVSTPDPVVASTAFRSRAA